MKHVNMEWQLYASHHIRLTNYSHLYVAFKYHLSSSHNSMVRISGKVVTQFQVTELFWINKLIFLKHVGSRFLMQFFFDAECVAAEATDIDFNAEKVWTYTLSIIAISQQTLTITPTVTSSASSRKATCTALNRTTNTLPQKNAAFTSSAQQVTANNPLDNTTFHRLGQKQFMPYLRMTKKRARQVRRRGKQLLSLIFHIKQS